jgi:serine/threonine protein kinase
MKDRYIILYSKNGSCTSLKPGELVSIEQLNIHRAYDITPYKYLEKKNGKHILQTLDQNKIKFQTDKLMRFCGDLSNHYTIYNLFSNKLSRKKNIKHIIESLNFLVENGIVHCDLKLQNYIANNKGDIKIIDFGGAFSLKNPEYFDLKPICSLISSNNKKQISERTKYNNNFVNEILDFISIHTEYYTPPEILILKLHLNNYNKRDILIYLLKNYNITSNDLSAIKQLHLIINYVIKQKKEMYYNILCDKDNINTFIYKFDTFSTGIMLREILKILNKYFDLKVEKTLINLVEKMTDFNFNNRLNINEILKHEYLHS